MWVALLSLYQTQASSDTHPWMTSGRLVALNHTSMPVTPTPISGQDSTPTCPSLPRVVQWHQMSHNTEPHPQPHTGTRRLFSHVLSSKPEAPPLASLPLRLHTQHLLCLQTHPEPSPSHSFAAHPNPWCGPSTPGLDYCNWPPASAIDLSGPEEYC